MNVVLAFFIVNFEHMLHLLLELPIWQLLMFYTSQTRLNYKKCHVKMYNISVIVLLRKCCDTSLDISTDPLLWWRGCTS